MKYMLYTVICGQTILSKEIRMKIFKKIQPDIVHCHSSEAGIVGRLAAKKCKVPLIIYTPHDYVFQSPDISLIKDIFTYMQKGF